MGKKFMNQQNQIKKIFISGTIRGGSSVICNALNAHSEIIIISELIHFFRFVYKYYDPLNENDVRRLLEEMNARIYWRSKAQIDIDYVFQAIKSNGFTYPIIYESILSYFLKKFDKTIAGEDAPNSSDSIGDFVALFPDAKIIHVIRDPRAVLSSWQTTTKHSTSHLGVIFNCMNNFDTCKLYNELLPDTVYHSVKYEEFLLEPETQIRKICKFIGVNFEPLMVQPEKWNEMFDGIYMRRGTSSHIGELQEGFDSSRINTWKNKLEEWELCLCELLLKDRMRDFNYEVSNRKFSIDLIRRGIDAIRDNPYVYKLYSGWIANDKGSDSYPSNPRDPHTWGLPGEMYKKFLDTEDGEAYLQEIGIVNDKY